MGNQEMRTPRWLFNQLKRDFGPFKLDAAASKENALCRKYYTEKQNGLIQPWESPTFCNAPFKLAGKFVKKAFEEWSARKISSVLIVPVGCSQEWWHSFAKYADIYYPMRRISFDKPDGTPTRQADRDSVILHFDSMKFDFDTSSTFRGEPFHVQQP